MEQWQFIGLLMFAAIIMEFIDSSLGMMYGTVLSPLLILLGVDAKVVVPSLLISQAFGGFTASYRHQKFNNADFTKGTIDHKITTTLIWFGVLASVIGGVRIRFHFTKSFEHLYRLSGHRHCHSDLFRRFFPAFKDQHHAARSRQRFQ